MRSSAATPRTTLRERQSALTRSVILDVARRQFAESGYAAATVRPIAKEAGISLQTLYSTFGSKQGILEVCGDIIVTFREGAAGDPEVAAAYDVGQRRLRDGLDRMCGRLQELGALRPEL